MYYIQTDAVRRKEDLRYKISKRGTLIPLIHAQKFVRTFNPIQDGGAIMAPPTNFLLITFEQELILP